MISQATSKAIPGTMRRRRWLAALAVAAAMALGAGDLMAVVGDPATPLSYAGVARRSSRRPAHRTAARQAAVVGPTVAALPMGCARVPGQRGVIYGCAGRYYRPTYDGPNIVYIVTTHP
jgi:hypothetical protein